MEFRGLVPLWSAIRAFVLSGAELSKVLGGFGHSIGEEMHLDSAQWFT